MAVWEIVTANQILETANQELELAVKEPETAILQVQVPVKALSPRGD